MKINVAKLSNRQTNGLQNQSGKEVWLNGPGMIVAKFIFWLIVFFSIIVEVDGQNNQMSGFSISTADRNKEEIVKPLDLYGKDDGIADDIYL